MDGRRQNFNAPNKAGGNRRVLRDAQRGYEHFNTRNQLADWSYEPQPFEPSRVKPRASGPTARSQNFKKQAEEKKQQKMQEKNNSSAFKPATTETPPRDGPLYDIGPHSTLVPLQDVHVQNFEFSGFIPLVEETYEKLRGIDPRLAERLPLSMFQHVACNHLNLQIAEIARQNGQNILGTRTDFREVLPDYQCLPAILTDYIADVSNTITQIGVELKLNLPEIAIPQGPDGNIDSGSFGPINAQTHNVYEAYINPLVTANQVITSQQNNANYQPLPAELIPANLVPTRNLLGYGPIDAQNPGMQQRLQGVVFPNDDSIEGRYKVSHTACSRVYIILSELKDRFHMTEFRREENKNGLNYIEKIIPQVTSANLTFVESEGPVNPLVTPLFDRNVNVCSNSAQGSSTANHANLMVMHRRRVVRGANAAVGPCYCTAAAQTPGGWAATANDNFELAGLFAAVIHFDYATIRQPMFVSRGPAGVRRNVLSSFIERNYYVKK